MAYSIIVHSPDKARIPFTVSSGSITLEDVPALIKKLLTREKHQITSDLILQQDVSLTEHSFLVVRESQGRYHVFALPGRYSSYEVVGNQARQLYAGVFNSDFDWNRVNLCSCDRDIKEIHSQEDHSNFGMSIVYYLWYVPTTVGTCKLVQSNTRLKILTRIYCHVFLFVFFCFFLH